MDEKYAKELINEQKIYLSTIGKYRGIKAHNIAGTGDERETDILYNSSYNEILMVEDLSIEDINNTTSENKEVQRDGNKD